LIDMQPTFDLTAAKELDARATDGVDVRLLWHPPTNGVAVEVIDSRSGEQFALAIDGTDALDAFHHPFAYAASDADAALLTRCSRELRKEVTTWRRS
jgi:hypothetical protein